MDNTNLVLLVEDDPSDERLAMRALARSNVNCSIDVARDGEEAVQYLADPGQPCPKLVLLDLKLPKRNGLEVLKEIRKEAKTRRIPVICFSSSAEQADVKGCYDNGANSFVRKAVDYDEYMERLRKMAEYWLQINESFL